MCDISSEKARLYVFTYRGWRGKSENIKEKCKEKIKKWYCLWIFLHGILPLKTQKE